MQNNLLISDINQLAAFAKAHQLTAQQVINGRIYIDGQGWTSVEFTDELADKLKSMIVDALGGQTRTQVRIANVLRCDKPQHWGLSRLFLEQYQDNAPRFHYCAGQDYPAELRTIRQFLSK